MLDIFEKEFIGDVKRIDRKDSVNEGGSPTIELSKKVAEYFRSAKDAENKQTVIDGLIAFLNKERGY